MDLSRERERVLNVLFQALETSNNEELDTIARIILDLPERPDGALPFIGWLLPITNLKKDDIINSNHLKKTSLEGINFIKKYEGFRAKAYYCPGKVLTIGYGHTRTVKPEQYITIEKAENLLLDDLKIFEDAVNQLVEVPLNQAQFDALVSFTFNCGISAFKKSTLLSKLNFQDYDGAAKEFTRWIYANGEILSGLVRRRNEEKIVFES